ncbi:MAG TPA: OmpA family protein [Brevundimonas sp.]|jgi:outer membrane protein OmpA-like peptidoglycan-associated protein
MTNGRILVGVALLAGLGLAGCETSGRAFKDRSQIVETPTVCTPKRFEIYFADSEARLTGPARQAIGLTATQLQGCNIKSVKVLGLSDARGGADANLDLSERRAKTVAEALAAAGWPSPAFEVGAAGDEGAANASGVREPLRRRTEVLVDAAPN